MPTATWTGGTSVCARRSRGRAWQWRVHPARLLAPRYQRHRQRKIGDARDGNPLVAGSPPRHPRCCAAEDEPVRDCSLPAGLRRRHHRSTYSSRRKTSTMTTRPTKSWSTSPRIFARRSRRGVRLHLLAKIRGEVDQLLVGRVVIVDVRPRTRAGGSSTPASQTRWELGAAALAHPLSPRAVGLPRRERRLPIPPPVAQLVFFHQTGRHG